MSFSKIALVSYWILVLTGIVIPSDGDHGLVSIKSVAFFGASVTWVLYLWWKQEFSLYQWRLILFTACAFLFVVFWSSLGFFLEQTHLDSIWGEAKVVSVTFIFIVMTLYYVSEGLIDLSSYLKFLVFGNFFYSLTKVSAVVGHVLGVFDIITVLEGIGIRYMSMDIVGSMIRMQTSVDLLTPFLILFVLLSDQLGLRLSRRFRCIWIVVSVLACALSFSRFFLFVMVLSGGLSCFVYSWKRSLLYCCVILCFTLGVEPLREALFDRFSGVETTFSDEARTQQIMALEREFLQYPLLGKGMGGYAKEVIRDESLPYSYEVQWGALFMQFGLIGMAFFLFPLIYIFRHFHVYSALSVSFLGLFILWLIAGVTNPYVLSLTSGIIDALFLLTGEKLLCSGKKKMESSICNSTSFYPIKNSFTASF